jgi:hypothetical protein
MYVGEVPEFQSPKRRKKMVSANSQSRPTWGEVEAVCSTTSIGLSPVAACAVAANSGRIQRVTAAPGGTTTGTITITVSINGGSDICGGSLQIAPGSGPRNSGSVFEFQDNVGVGANASPYINEGDAITFTPSGGGGSSIPGAFGLIIRSN